MANEEGFITPEKYKSEWQDFYRPINIKRGTSTTTPVSSPNLAAESGIKVSVEKPDINVNIKKINDPNHNPFVKDADGNNTPYFNILSGTKFASSAIKHTNFKSMMGNVDKLDQPKKGKGDFFKQEQLSDEDNEMLNEIFKEKATKRTLH